LCQDLTGNSTRLANQAEKKFLALDRRVTELAGFVLCE
jgi:hypothetical protein